MRHSIPFFHKMLSLLIIVLTFIFLAVKDTNALSPQEILKRSDVVRRFGRSYSTVVSITTYKSDNIQSINKYEVFTKDNGDKMLVKFISPKQEIGKFILMVGQDMWIFLPDVGKPLKIPSSQRLIGDVAYGDIARINYNRDYNADLIDIDIIKGRKCFVLLLQAKDETATYGTIKYWITTEDYHPIKAEYHTSLGKLIKIGLFEDYQNINGTLRPTKILLFDELRNTKSVLEYSNVTQRDIPDKFFDKNYMGRLR